MKNDAKIKRQFYRKLREVFSKMRESFERAWRCRGVRVQRARAQPQQLRKPRSALQHRDLLQHRSAVVGRTQWYLASSQMP